MFFAIHLPGKPIAAQFEFQVKEPQNAIQSLSEIFAIYLTDYSDVGVYVESGRLDPSKLIVSREKFELSPIEDNDRQYPAEVEVIEWTSASERWFYLCGPEGFPFHRVTPKFHTPGFEFSAYLKSTFISTLQEQGLLELAEMNAPLQAAYDEASDRIKAHFRAKEIEGARSEIEQWKTEEIYPYRTEPQTTVEKAERQFFEIVALNVNKHLQDFAGQSKRTKAFQLRMLRQAIERGPDELQRILTEVLDLPERTRRSYRSFWRRPILQTSSARQSSWLIGLNSSTALRRCCLIQTARSF